MTRKRQSVFTGHSRAAANSYVHVETDPFTLWWGAQAVLSGNHRDACRLAFDAGRASALAVLERTRYVVTTAPAANLDGLPEWAGREVALATTVPGDFRPGQQLFDAIRRDRSRAASRLIRALANLYVHDEVIIAGGRRVPLRTVADLWRLTADDLARQRGVGRKGVAMLRVAWRACGVEWKG